MGKRHDQQNRPEDPALKARRNPENRGNESYGAHSHWSVLELKKPTVLKLAGRPR
jgi:hypothetical protein